MHSLGVVHTDITPENIMFNKNDDIKFIDFGLARRMQTNKKEKELSNIPYYTAPEALDGTFTSKCDMWSMGVLLYVFMSGYLPF